MVGLVILLSGGLVACGDDDDTEAAQGEASEFCEGYLALTAGDPDPATIREVAATAPGEGREALEAIADGVESEGEAYFEGDEFGDNFQTVGQVASQECADEELEVTAREYEFEGVPDSLDAGIVAVTLENEGKESHEIVLFRRADGETRSFDDLLALDEDEAKGALEEKGGTFAEPGASAPGLFQLDEPGDYVAVCFIPTGTTPDNEESEGAPHFTNGMKVEFTVE